MESLRKKYILILVAVTLALVVVIIKFPNVAPFGWAIGGVVFFFLYEIASILIIDKKGNTISARQSINLLGGLKIGKILLSLFFLVIYWIIEKTEMKRFLLVFFTIYLIYLVIDTLYLTSREKKAKEKKLITEV